MSCVARGALPLYPRHRKLRRVATAPRFRRGLVVVTPRELPAHKPIRQFVENTLF